MGYVLFISEQKLKDGSGLNGNIDMEYLLPYLKIAQKKYVETKLGTDLYEKLQADITANSLIGNYAILVEDYVQEMLVHWAFYESLPFLRYKIMNNNIFQKTGETGQTLSREEAQDLREEVRNTAEFYTERLIDYLCNNNNLFPEYTTNTGADVRPDSVSFYSGMNLERPKRKERGITIDDFLPL